MYAQAKALEPFRVPIFLLDTGLVFDGSVFDLTEGIEGSFLLSRGDAAFRRKGIVYILAFLQPNKQAVASKVRTRSIGGDVIDRRARRWGNGQLRLCRCRGGHGQIPSIYYHPHHI